MNCCQFQVGERIFRVGGRVIHRRNNYDLGVFNGDIGVIQEIDNEELTCVVSFFPDQRIVEYKRNDIPELDLSCAITIHKSQGSEFGAVIIPILTQHFKMLFQNLIYTDLTRARKFAVLVGTRKTLAMAVKNHDTSQRQTYLKELIFTILQFHQPQLFQQYANCIIINSGHKNEGGSWSRAWRTGVIIK